MQGPASLPHTPPENAETTRNPCWAPFKDQESPSIRKLGRHSPQSPLHLHTHVTAPPPAPQGQPPGGERLPRPDRQVLPSDPGPALCLGTQLQTRQAMPGTGLPRPSTSFSPTPTPAQGHICFGKQPVLSY